MSDQVRGRKRHTAPRPHKSQRSAAAYEAEPSSCGGLLFPYASLLFPEPKFFMGIGSVFDLAGALANVTYAGALPDLTAPLINFNYAISPSQADYLALLSDHCALAADWKAARPHLKAS